MSKWHVKVISQSTANLCWEASARMLWVWRHKGIAGYEAKAGTFSTRNTGLTEIQMDAFYKQLGLRSTQQPKGVNLQLALQGSPVIFTSLDKASGHAMVLSGYHGGKYDVVNPCGVMAVDFETDASTCDATAGAQSASAIEGKLGNYIWYW